MIDDIVIDTNILVHADNNEEPRQEHCIAIIDKLYNSQQFLCMDEGFDVVESKNSSFIGYEYMKHLRFGMQGYALILKLVQEDRLRFVPKTIPASINNKINRTGIKKSDRVFVKVSFNSDNKILVTHDYEDFTTKVRGIIKNEVGVFVLDADQV
jgi:predicted nucleic acid-binding protein